MRSYVNLCVWLGTAEVIPYVDADLKHTAAKVVEKAKAICQTKSVRSLILSKNKIRIDLEFGLIFISIYIYSINLDC